MNKIIFGCLLALVGVPVLSQTQVEMPSMRGNWTFQAPVNLYCKLDQRLGYFKTDKGWVPMKFPTDDEPDFIYKFEVWDKLSIEELKACNLYEDEITKYEKEKNWKLCGIKTYPSQSTKLYPSICTPMRNVNGDLNFTCGDGEKVDVSGRVVIADSGKFGFLQKGVVVTDLNKCIKIN